MSIKFRNYLEWKSDPCVEYGNCGVLHAWLSERLPYEVCIIGVTISLTEVEEVVNNTWSAYTSLSLNKKCYYFFPYN